MTRGFVIVIISIFLSIFLLSYKSVFPDIVMAQQCCDNGPCGSTGTCVATSGCPGIQGHCVSNYETCTNSSQCPGGETCINNLCYGSGGPPAPTVHDGCSPYGLILKCGTPDPANFACKNSQGGCWGNWPGPVGQPTGGDCNTDHPRASNHTECQTNCWCESPCDANAWQACSTSCVWGVQYNACGTPRSCIVNDPNAWGAWSACSATCDGGTQTGINSCGATQSQSCQVAGRILKIRAV